MTEHTVREHLKETALKAPSHPGVYLWKSPDDVILYVGKAKNLKNRLMSYFSSTHLKTRLLVSAAAEIDYITTNNEYEALILENNLIKTHNPRYNINLKDDKSYPSLCVTREKYPRVFATRNVSKNGSRYYGPYPSALALSQFLEALRKIYPLRRCRKLQKRSAPCMYYHISQCAAPCCGKISPPAYTEYIDEITALLEENSKDHGAEGERFASAQAGLIASHPVPESSRVASVPSVSGDSPPPAGGEGEPGGGKKSATTRLLDAMKEAAGELNFEKAARLRDGLRALSVLRMENVVQNSPDAEDRDYIAWAEEGELVSFVVLKIRSGKLLSKDVYRTQTMSDDADLAEEFFLAYYDSPAKLPPAIYLDSRETFAPAHSSETEGDSAASEKNAPSGIPWHFAEKSGSYLDSRETSASVRSPGTAADNGDPEKNASPVIPRYFAERFGCSPRILKADSPRHESSLDLAKQNAAEDIERRVRERGDLPAMEELKRVLGLPSLPRRIEGFDIAHLDGKFPVASLVSFKDGNPDKSQYRYFRLRTTDGVIDDFASLREAAMRRYSRLLKDHAPLPDLIMIDGGIGQVNSVQEVLGLLQADIPLVGLAKRNEELYLPNSGTPLVLPRRSDALRLLQRVRDETHRFATTKNQQLRAKEAVGADTRIKTARPPRPAPPSDAESLAADALR